MNNEILLNDVLQLNSVELERTKIRFSIATNLVRAIDEYLRDPDLVNNQWLFWREGNRRFSEGDFAVSLVHIGDERWLLTTVKRVDRDLDVREGINHEGSEVSALAPWFGRTIVRFKKSFQQSVIHAPGVIDEMVVEQVLRDVYSG